MVDSFYLNLAIQQAWKYQILTFPNPAVGCAVVKNGKLLALKAHKKAGFAHAELRACKQALKKLNKNLVFPKDTHQLYEFILKHHNNLLKDSTFYVTLEPCSHVGKTPSCALLLKALGVKKVFIGYKDENKIASGGASILAKSGIEVKWSKNQQKCKELLEPFLQWQESNFSFFKLALSANGVMRGGIITNKSSRKFTHKLRNVCELLLIGGNTVRVDRPILDARMCNGRASDVMIYSKRNDFDKNIPLFNVPNRQVFISDDIRKIDNYKLTMLEGAEGLLRAMQEKVKWYLIFHSPNFIDDENVKTSLKLKLMWQGKIKNDTYGWYKSYM